MLGFLGGEGREVDQGGWKGLNEEDEEKEFWEEEEGVQWPAGAAGMSEFSGREGAEVDQGGWKGLNEDEEEKEFEEEEVEEMEEVCEDGGEWVLQEQMDS